MTLCEITLALSFSTSHALVDPWFHPNDLEQPLAFFLKHKEGNTILVNGNHFSVVHVGYI
jgi:hypothetical protein